MRLSDTGFVTSACHTRLLQTTVRLIRARRIRPTTNSFWRRLRKLTIVVSVVLYEFLVGGGDSPILYEFMVWDGYRVVVPCTYSPLLLFHPFLLFRLRVRVSMGEMYGRFAFRVMVGGLKVSGLSNSKTCGYSDVDRSHTREDGGSRCRTRRDAFTVPGVWLRGG